MASEPDLHDSFKYSEVFPCHHINLKKMVTLAGEVTRKMFFASIVYKSLL